ncbi:MAG: hypothetical protein RLZZ521_1558, partial [Pseudomonadota bacterium]
MNTLSQYIKPLSQPTKSFSQPSTMASEQLKAFSVWLRLILSVLAGCLLVLQMQACSSRATSQAEIDRLTQPEPDSVRQRAIRRITLASAYFAQDQMDAAMQETRAALQIDPDFAQAYSLL